MALSPPKSAAAAIRGIERAHRTFKVGALRKLHPDLAGAELARAVGREELRDAGYLVAMRKRLVDGARKIEATTPPGERAPALATLISSEHRFLGQHIEAAGWRMRSEATTSRLKAAGEPGAVWLKDETKQTHTADCLAMDARFWPWEVLDRVNPANRHTGCGCALVSRDEATARGVSWKRGRRGPAVKREISLVEARKAKAGAHLTPTDFATPMPRFGATRDGGEWNPEEHPRSLTNGRFVRIAGVLPRSLHPSLKVWQNAVAAGDTRRARLAFTDLYRQARALPVPKTGKNATDAQKRARQDAEWARRDAILTAQRLNAAVVNPTGAKLPVGTTLKVGAGGDRLPVGVTAHSAGILEPWTAHERFGWSLPRSEANDMRAKNALRHGHFEVTSTADGHFIETSSKLDPTTARAIARLVEIDEPHLRRLRASEPGELIHDESPLDVGDDEKVSHRGNPAPSPYGAVRDWQIGLAAELSAADVMHRLKELGRIDMDDDRLVLPAGHDADDQAPLDILMDGLGLESKAEPLRDYHLGDTGHSASIDRVQTARKRAAAQRGTDLDTKGGEKPLKAASRALFDDVQGTAKLRDGTLAKGLRPGILTQLVDADTGIVHVFLHEYPNDEDAFTSQPRLPSGMSQRLVDGTIRPGELSAPARGPHAGDLDHATMFVGSFPLRYNPVGADVGKDLSPGEMVKRLRAGGPQSADVGVAGQKVRVVGRKAAEPKAAKRATIADKALALEDKLRAADARGLSQKEIAAELKVDPATVSRYMKHLGMSPGKGARPDLKRKGALDIQHRSPEKKTPPGGAR